MTGTDVELHQAQPPERARDWLELMGPAAELAGTVANTEFVPSALRGKPAAVAAAILYGDEVGLGPMQSINKLDVIDGRVAMRAESMRALIQAAGHRIWMVEGTNTSVTFAGIRKGDTDAQQVTVKWTLDDAKRAGLDGRPNWRKYPRAQLTARASSELARTHFADVIAGLVAIEELEDDPGFNETRGAGPDDEGGTAPPAPTPTTKRKRRARATQSPPPAAAAAPAPEPPAEPPLPGEEDNAAPPPEEGSMPFPNWYAMKLNELGFNDDERHALTLYISDRRTETSKDLSPSERATARDLVGLGRAAIFEALGWAEDAPDGQDGEEAQEGADVVDLAERRQEPPEAEDPGDVPDAEVVIETVDQLRALIKAKGVRNSDVIKRAQQENREITSLTDLVEGPDAGALEQVVEWLNGLES